MVKISLAGDLGSGKSTVSAILTAELPAEYYATGRIVRDIAERRGMTVVELNEYMETHPEIDHEIDAGLVALSELDKSLVIDSRMAWHFTKNTFKVYLSTDTQTSALRIMSANRSGEHAASLEETVRQTRARRESEKKRYFEQYGVHIKDLSNYSLVVDTTYATPREVADCILGGLREWQNNPEYRRLYISPERVNYPTVAPNEERLAELISKIEAGELPLVSLAECDGEFYLTEGPEEALAYSLTDKRYIPARLVSCERPTGEFVKMKNSL